MGQHSLESAQPSTPPNIFNIRSKNDVAVLFYFLLPLVQVALVTYGVADNKHVALWFTVVVGIAQLIFQAARTQDFMRRAIYSTLNLANIMLVTYVAGYNPEWLDGAQPILTLLLGGSAAAVAAQNVNTTGSR